MNPSNSGAFARNDALTELSAEVDDCATSGLAAVDALAGAAASAVLPATGPPNCLNTNTPTTSAMWRARITRNAVDSLMLGTSLLQSCSSVAVAESFFLRGFVASLKRPFSRPRRVWLRDVFAVYILLILVFWFWVWEWLVTCGDPLAEFGDFLAEALAAVFVIVEQVE